jgi:hypothetical protein
MKSTMNSDSNLPSVRKTIGPPSKKPIAAMATRIIPKTSATIGNEDRDSPLRSLRLMPQRLQKLRPAVMGEPHAEQYIKFPFGTEAANGTAFQ